jgi:hypothetical protein
MSAAGAEVRTPKDNPKASVRRRFFAVIFIVFVSRPVFAVLKCIKGKGALNGPECGAPSTPGPVAGNCGMQLGSAVSFCETFDTKNPGIPSRTGDLNPNVWGVSRTSGGNKWATTRVETCNGLTAKSASATRSSRL